MKEKTPATVNEVPYYGASPSFTRCYYIITPRWALRIRRICERIIAWTKNFDRQEPM